MKPLSDEANAATSLTVLSMVWFGLLLIFRGDREAQRAIGITAALMVVVSVVAYYWASVLP